MEFYPHRGIVQVRVCEGETAQVIAYGMRSPIGRALRCQIADKIGQTARYPTPDHESEVQGRFPRLVD